jgi:putative flippase GtrA
MADLPDVNSYIPTHMSNSRLLKFLFAGGIGFIVDALVLSLLTTLVGWQPIPARIASFIAAASATWWINRHLAFAMQRAVTTRATRDEYTRYLGTQSLGAAINLGLFASLLWRWPMLNRYPVIALAIASVCALFFNYFVMRRFVFRHDVSSALPR